MTTPGESAQERTPELPRVPGYRIEGVLGSGATGVVYRATQTAVERPVALKILRPDLVGTRRAVRRLQREARTAAKLAHPSIISAIDMGEVGGLWWYAMELVEGESLSERIAASGPLSEREALRLFSPLCDALQHAFEGGVVHRDIKPANILIDTHGRARLVDLGLAFAEDDPMLTKPGGTLGTPHFISPEQARDPSSADTRSDIWSLGATMYQALCGRPPFQGESVAEILSGVLYQRIPDPRQLAPHLSRGIAMVVRKCLNRDPDRRYQQPAELMRDLERLRERRQPAIRAGALDPVAGHAGGWRDPRVLVAAAVTAVALFVVGSSLGWFGDNAVEAPTTRRAPEAWPELEHVARTFERGTVRHHGALLALDRLQVPPEFEVRLSEIKTVVLTDLDKALRGWRQQGEARVEASLEKHDWAGTREFLAEGLGRALAQATGFSGVDGLPAGRREEQRVWLAGLERRFEEEVQAAREAASDALARHYANEVRGRVRTLGRERRWRDALELVDTPPLRWLEEADTDLRGFDDAALADIGRRIAVERNADRKDLLNAWLDVAGELVRWIDHTQETLRGNLEGGDERGVADKLREAFRRELALERVDPAQVPGAWDQRPFRHAERAARELADREALLVARFARGRFVDDTRVTAALCRRRDYGSALAHWRARAEDPLFATLAEDVQLRVRECELLQSVLQRAAEGVRQRSGKTFECYVGNILQRGTVQPPVDPLRRGFELETRHDSIGVHLVAPAGELPAGDVLLRAADVEALAGLSGTRISPEERLLKALFRYYEGDLAEAQAALPIGSLAEDALVSALAERIRVAREAASAREQEREGDLVDALRSIKWSFERAEYPVDPRRLQADVAAVYERFGDILSEKDRDDLRGIQEALDRALSGPTLERALGPFGPGDVVRTGPLGFELRFRFADGQPGAWRRGAWTGSDGGWSLPQALATDPELLDRSGAISIELAEPFDTGGRIRLTLELDPVWTAGLENVLLVSIVGYHIAFLDDPASPRVFVDTTSASEVLSRVRAGEVQGFGSFAGLPRERPYRVEVSLSPAGGKLDHVLVDDVELTVRSLYKKPPEPGREIVIRSKQPVRLVEARLEGRRAN